MDATTPPDTTTTPARKAKTPRPAASYRGARRNFWHPTFSLRDRVRYFDEHEGKLPPWPAPFTNYRPYMPKRDKFSVVPNPDSKHDNDKFLLKGEPRKQPKFYPYGSTRQGYPAPVRA